MTQLCEKFRKICAKLLQTGWIWGRSQWGEVRQVVSPTLPFPLSLPSPFPFPPKFSDKPVGGKVRSSEGGSSPASPPLQIPPWLQIILLAFTVRILPTKLRVSLQRAVTLLRLSFNLAPLCHRTTRRYGNRSYWHPSPSIGFSAVVELQWSPRVPGQPERPGGPRETSVLRVFKGACKRLLKLQDDHPSFINAFAICKFFVLKLQ